MKNITLSAKEEAIARARQVAQDQGTTLNELFREWLNDLDNSKQQIENRLAAIDDLWERTGGYAQAGKHFTRDEMNER